MMPPDEIESLLSEIREMIYNSGKTFAQDLEFTIEINPEDVIDENIRAWKKIGINRASLGVQSFNDKLLKLIGRNHSSRQAYDALAILTEEFDNVSADLIFGLPGEASDDLISDINIFTSFHPQHISIYSLMYEEGTALTLLRDNGEIRESTESDVIEMYDIIRKILSEEGYLHYEISNYSLPGFQSRHNSGYWSGRAYLGLGPSAHSYDGHRLRKSNLPDIKNYIRGENILGSTEFLSDKELIEERIMLSLRRSEGLDLKKFRIDFGEDALANLLSKANIGIDNNVLSINDSHLRISEKSLMVSDRIILSLI